ncbi:hypothetical protein Tco_1204627 [Tanacetum coccineum]
MQQWQNSEWKFTCSRVAGRTKGEEGGECEGEGEDKGKELGIVGEFDGDLMGERGGFKEVKDGFVSKVLVWTFGISLSSHEDFFLEDDMVIVNRGGEECEV